MACQADKPFLPTPLLLVIVSITTVEGKLKQPYSIPLGLLMTGRQLGAHHRRGLWSERSKKALRHVALAERQHLPLGCPRLPVSTAGAGPGQCLLDLSNRLSDIYSNGHLKRLDVLSKSHLSDEISLVASEQPDISSTLRLQRWGWGESGSAGHRLTSGSGALGSAELSAVRR